MGDLLVRAGLITESQLRVTLAQQRQTGGKLGEHLVRTGLITEETLCKALAKQTGYLYNDLSHLPVKAVVTMLPHKAAERFQALPVAYDPHTQHLAVAFADPLDDAARMEVAKLTGKTVVPHVAPPLVLRRVIENAYSEIELMDEGTSEFQMVDSRGDVKAVKVRTGSPAPVADEQDEMPEVSAMELSALSAVDIGPVDPSRAAPQAIVTPLSTPARPGSDEALRTVWSIAELLIERGYFTRAELLSKIQKHK